MSMSKLEERESRRRSTAVGKFVEQTPVEAGSSGRRGRPKEDRELKKRISLSVLPSLYEDIRKIAYVQRSSISDLIGQMMEKYCVDLGGRRIIKKNIVNQKGDRDIYK
jgi:hypothetical protein